MLDEKVKLAASLLFFWMRLLLYKDLGRSALFLHNRLITFKHGSAAVWNYQTSGIIVVYFVCVEVNDLGKRT